jgi:hypothetical protein
MSSAGVIYEMIRRDKVNREMKNQRRQKRMDRRTASKIGGASSADMNTSWQELEQINRRLKEKRESDEQKTQSLMLIIFAGVLIAGLLLFFAIRLIYN